jgi:F-type H+-transporting ATPase subunit beta
MGLGNYAVEQTRTIDGRVTAVRGAVLDVAFDGVTLPPIDGALVITPDKGAAIIAEVQSHLDEATVRALALQSTAGLRRGIVAHATGGPLEVPVGEAVLARFTEARRRSLPRAVRRKSSRLASR